MVLGLPPAPRWAWIVMALAAVAIAGMSYLAADRPPPPGLPALPASTGARPVEEPAASSEPTTSGAPEEVGVLVVGEGVTASPGPGAASWAQLVAEDIARAGGPPPALTVAAAQGAGYVRTAAGGATFGQLVQDAGTGFDVVVLFGSRVDTAAAADVRTAAEAAFAAVRAASPDAVLLVIGPAWPTGDPPAFIESNRDALSAAAAGAGATFVDPLAERWLTAPGSVGPDGTGLTPQGQRFLADRVRPLVERVLPAQR